MPLSNPLRAGLRLAAWLLALLGAGMFVIGVWLGVWIVGWEWNNPYTDGGMIIVSLLLLVGAGLVVAGKRLDRRPTEPVRAEGRGFEVKLTVPTLRIDNKSPDELAR